MKNSRSVKKTAKFEKNSARVSRAMLVILLGVITAISALVISLVGGGSSNGVVASTNPKPTPVIQKRYKATRPIVVDQQTGELRMPTRQEIDQAVASLATLAKRQPEGLRQSALSSGAISVDLDGGYGGVMLARPKGDGTWETKCVFTIEEGAAFLGLVEERSQQ